jgi:hypothetical protein
MFWCQGNCATILPAAFLSESQEDADAQIQWDAPTQYMYGSMYGRGMCPARHFYWNAHSNYATHVDARVHEEG